MKFLHLNFLPRSADLALFAVRVWYGASLFYLHGWSKLTGFGAARSRFPDPLGIGHTPSLALAIFGEVVCTVLLVLGVFTRVAALGAGITMAVAFWIVNGHQLAAGGWGEIGLLYLGACVALFLGGGGKFSLDARFGAAG